MEEEVDGFGAAEVGVLLEGAGVGVEVFVGAELGGVDEVGDDDEVGVLAGDADEGEVSFVEVAHGGDEADGSAGGAGLEGEGLEFAGGFYDLHGVGSFCAVMWMRSQE